MRLGEVVKRILQLVGSKLHTHLLLPLHQRMKGQNHTGEEEMLVQAADKRMRLIEPQKLILEC